MRHRQPDITKIKNMIGFTPKVDLDEMIENVLKHVSK